MPSLVPPPQFINLVLLAFGVRGEAGETVRADTLDALADHSALVRYAAALAIAPSHSVAASAQAARIRDHHGDNEGSVARVSSGF